MQGDKEMPVASCPSRAVWDAIVSRTIADEEAHRLILHASGCFACASCLRLAISLGEKQQETVNENDVAEIAEPDWTFLAARASRKPRSRWLYYAAAAALLLLLVPTLLLLRQRRNRAPLDELAAAYTQNRQLEMRMDGAAWGPIRIQRGAEDDSQKPVESRLRRLLDSDPTNPQALQAYGRLWLLEWRPGRALDAFQLAARNAPSYSSFWVDFGLAWYEQALRNNAGRVTDLAQASECFDRALALDPRDAAALFNRGIVNLERNRPAAAVQDFQASLRVEPQGPWAEECRTRLSDARKAAAENGADLR